MFKETADQIDAAAAFLSRIGKVMDVPKLKKEVEKGEEESAHPAFWTDGASARKKSKSLNDLKKAVNEWENTGRALEDLRAHLELASEADDQGELKEVEKGLAQVKSRLAAMDARMKLSG
jgi:protein subunit release factor A